MSIVEKLNMRFHVGDGSDLVQEPEQVVCFCSSNFVKTHQVPTYLVEEALDLAGYFREDGDFTDADVAAAAEVIDDFASVDVKVGVLTQKEFWFEKRAE